MFRGLLLLLGLACVTGGCRKGAEQKIWDESTIPVKLELRLVKADAGEKLVLDDLEEDVRIDNSHIEDALAGTDEFGKPCVSLRMTRKGVADMLAFTTENIHRRVAIVGNGKIVSAPIIQSGISYSVQITGTELTEKEIDAFAAGIMKYKDLNSGQ